MTQEMIRQAKDAGPDPAIEQLLTQNAQLMAELQSFNQEWIRFNSNWNQLMESQNGLFHDLQLIKQHLGLTPGRQS